MRRIFEVNCVGASLIARSFFPLLRRSGGTLLLTGSATAMLQTGHKGLYEATKCALRGFANSLRGLP